MGYLDTEGFHRLMGVVIDYLKASTKEIEARTALMGMEYQEIIAKQEQEQKTQQGKGMMRAPYGYCPTCGAVGVYRGRATKTDRCSNNHIYPSNTAVLRFDKEDNHVNGNQS